MKKIIKNVGIFLCSALITQSVFAGSFDPKILRITNRSNQAIKVKEGWGSNKYEVMIQPHDTLVRVVKWMERISDLHIQDTDKYWANDIQGCPSGDLTDLTPIIVISTPNGKLACVNY